MADSYYASYYGSLPQQYELQSSGPVYAQHTGQVIYDSSGYSAVQVQQPQYESYPVAPQYATVPSVQSVPQYVTVPSVPAVQYAVQQPMPGAHYAAPVANAQYGSSIVHYTTQPYYTTSVEASVPVVGSTLTYETYRTEPMPAQSIVYAVPQQVTYQNTVGVSYQPASYDAPKIYAEPPSQGVLYAAESYDSTYRTSSNTPAFNSGLYSSYHPPPSPQLLPPPPTPSSSFSNHHSRNNSSHYKQPAVAPKPANKSHFSNTRTPEVPVSNRNVLGSSSHHSVPKHSKPLPKPTSNANIVKRPSFESSRHKEISKPVQLHYCSVCKLTCAGLQLYQEHLASDKHRKMVVSGESDAANSVSNESSEQSRRVSCEMCHISCQNADAYAAHIRSVEHQKVLQSHTSDSKSKKVTTPVVSAVSADNKLEDPLTKKNLESSKAEVDKDLDSVVHPEIQPIGLDMVEDKVNESGASVGLLCKLCTRDIPLSVGKMLHCKTRGHRQQYKNKVDPKLLVEAKPVRSLLDGIDKVKSKNESARDLMKRRMIEEQWRLTQERIQFEEHVKLLDRQRFAFASQEQIFPQRHVDTFNDSHVNAKHSSIYPSEAELLVIQSTVSVCEECLKLVSDNMPERCFTGVMRVGYVAKGLLIRGDREVNLVLLCTKKPTRSMLELVAKDFPKQLATLTEDTYDVEIREAHAAIDVTHRDKSEDITVTCVINVTSPLLRDQLVEQNEEIEPGDAFLDRDCCLEALAAVRHAKWFQAKVIRLPSCMILLRVLRDVSSRLAGWSSLSQWAIELLVEKCLSSVGEVGVNPGSALRRVLEAVSSGFLLPGGPGLYDPCEKDPSDVVGGLTKQQREDITSSAQLALRQIAFRKIDAVLGPVVEQLEKPVAKKRKRSEETDFSDEEGVNENLLRHVDAIIHFSGVDETETGDSEVQPSWH